MLNYYHMKLVNFISFGVFEQVLNRNVSLGRQVFVAECGLINIRQQCDGIAKDLAIKGLDDLKEFRVNGIINS